MILLLGCFTLVTVRAEVELGALSTSSARR